MKKFKIKQNKGMTYVELIVVLSIFAVLSSVVVFNYGAFQDRVDIKNLASDIALQVVQAQKSALAGSLPILGGYDSTWKPSYGVYFDTTSAPNKKQFIYFADLTNFGTYDSNEILNTISITKNNYISNLSVYPGGRTINDLTITFSRPDSGAILYSGGAPLTVSYVQITIKSPKGATALIKLYPSGRVQVN
jgi:prepilin-type N-terminal cleavage/methylation domain-containing protein